MSILHDDIVIITPSKKEGEEATIVTVNCPDKTGLGSDLCRIILFFGLTILRGDVSTDGKWCYIVFWVVGKEKTRWSLLKKRLIAACPSFSSAYAFSFYSTHLPSPKPPDLFLLKFCCKDRKGLLHDVTEVLCELELTIQKVKVSTTPDGRVLDLFFITDPRELLHTEKRRDDIVNKLTPILENVFNTIDIELVDPSIFEKVFNTNDTEPVDSETTDFSQASPPLPNVITYVFDLQSGTSTSDSVSIVMDNKLSPAHTLVQIMCHDHKGLLYDIMRTLKEYNIQISYGRFSKKSRGKCEIDLFIRQVDGKKIVDPSKQESLSSRLKIELLCPLKVAVVSRGPDTELLVSNPVELSGRGRPLVFHDITLALKMLGLCIFAAEVGRHVIGEREWEVYRILLDEVEGLPFPRNKIEKGVWEILMGWQ
ncbi:ACT domain-containing protein ACR10-like [Vicia villosa]|uniref:ACT domain-containing protein ACR10-like n=1 Tax=Vicia villosa TaxID=3911 RepID=UPI00273B2A2E|nr:ACT domain-containing protein ACR10-like [Vicia villosa]